MADLTDIQSAQSVKVIGSNANGSETNPLEINSSGNPAMRLKDSVTGLEASIILDGGVNKLQTLADVTVNSLRGFDPIADTWFYIGTENNSTGVGSAGNTVTVQIDAGDNLVDFPAVNESITVIAGDNEETLASRIVSELNLNTNFTLRFRAQKINKKAVTVYITAKESGPQGERPAIDSFRVVTTGTTVCTRAFQNIIRRQKQTSLARDPQDPTLGVLGISGSVTSSQGDVTSRFLEYLKFAGSDDLRLNGSVTPIDVTFTPSTTDETFISAIRIVASGNGIKFGQFLNKSALTNGLLFSLQSNGSTLIFPPLKTTDDLLAVFSFGNENFSLFIQAGGDVMRATLSFDVPVQISKIGSFPINDFLNLRIRDDLTALTSFKVLVSGYRREF
jgi:hypothetical protein